MENLRTPEHTPKKSPESNDTPAISSIKRNIKRAAIVALLSISALGTRVANHSLREAAENSPALQTALKTLDMMDFVYGTSTPENYYQWKVHTESPYPYEWE